MRKADRLLHWNYASADMQSSKGSQCALVASQPAMRGWFVELVDRDNDAPLEWMFEALYNVGQTAIPINMIILGCNLAASFSNPFSGNSTMSHNNNNNNNNNNNTSLDSRRKDPNQFSRTTIMAIVISKLLVVPLVGFSSVLFLKRYWWEHSLPKDIASSFYLLVSIVFLTPTANTVMVMVELHSGSVGGSGGEGAEAAAKETARSKRALPKVLHGNIDHPKRMN
jgi:predicted permease